MLFESPPLDLRELLDHIYSGQIQLPDFQRSWKWDDERIVSLLATVTLGYPLGVVMTLRTGGTGTRFKPRPLAGADVPAGIEPAELLMDGQQRLTSLFQALRAGKPVETTDSRKKNVTRWYYLDISRSLNPLISREEAILSVPADRKVRDGASRGVDLSTQEAECAAGLFPLRLAFDASAINEWQRGYVRSDETRWDIWGTFQSQVLKNVADYRLPVIRLAKETPKEAVCTVFEKVNTGGVPLNVFELLTATYAGDLAHFEAHGEDFQLPGHWKLVREELAEHAMLETLQDTDFLQAICLVSTHYRRRGRADVDPFTQPAASCKRGDILDLPLDEFIKWSPEVVAALHWTAGFLGRQGVFGAADLPYRGQVTSLAAIRAVMGADTDGPEAEDKISRWYWCGVLGEQYGGSPDSRLPRDLEQVVAWVRGGRAPDSVAEATFPETRLNTMSSRNSAAYKGVLALLMRQGCIDWTYTKEPINATIFADQQVDVALVFPKVWCDKKGISRERRDSIVNKTPLTNRTRRIMGSHAPDVYLRQLEAEAGMPGNWMDDIVGTHLIDSRFLRGKGLSSTGLSDRSFAEYYETRAVMLKNLIDEAMGKTGPGAAEDQAVEQLP
ncbi:MAG TPA: DUF262 domain-containing protein [Streptosporangiaceae bacterium]|nr:DUF262 domain-containing protein [Streptosporangiaceae bacterium]